LIFFNLFDSYMSSANLPSRVHDAFAYLMIGAGTWTTFKNGQMAFKQTSNAIKRLSVSFEVSPPSLQALAAFVRNLHAAQGRAVHAAAHDDLMQQLRIQHARDDALTAKAASHFLSKDPDDMGVAPQHVDAVREAVAFSMQLGEGGGRTSFMDLSEAAQVLLIRVACVVVSALLAALLLLMMLMLLICFDPARAGTFERGGPLALAGRAALSP
jgi:hypothetical protein